MEKYICSACKYIYDPAIGEPFCSIDKGTDFADIPEEFACPICALGKDAFEVLA